MTAVDLALSVFPAIDLATLDERASMRCRKDRKYIVSTDVALDVLLELQDVEVLHTRAGRWSAYASTYWDTPDLDVHRMAAARHPDRFKVRTRSYLDAGLCFVEVKTRDRRGRTIKQRWPVDGNGPLDPVVRSRAAAVDQSTQLAGLLGPRLTTTYRRATLVGTRSTVRATLDVGYRAQDVTGRHTGLPDRVVVETKTLGAPCDVDRLLWRRGVRPVKFSKYTTALAALHPDLPANRWHRVLREHFDLPARISAQGAAAPTPTHAVLSSAPDPQSMRTTDHGVPQRDVWDLVDEATLADEAFRMEAAITGG